MSRTRERIARWHALSGLLIAAFTAVHLLNHASALGGPAAWAAFRAFLRRFYQVPDLEVLGLALPILFSTVSGIWLAMQPHPGPAALPAAGIRGMRRRFHRASGIALVALVPLHAMSTRGAALLFDIDPDFHYVATMLSGWRGASWWALYALLVLAASYHLSNGLFTLLDECGAFPGRLSRTAGAAALLLVGLSLLMAGMLGLLSFGGVAYPKPSFETLPID